MNDLRRSAPGAEGAAGGVGVDGDAGTAGWGYGEDGPFGGSEQADTTTSRVISDHNLDISFYFQGKESPLRFVRGVLSILSEIAAKKAHHPAKDLEFLEELENRVDLDAARAALKEKAPRIPWKQLPKQQGDMI